MSKALEDTPRIDLAREHRFLQLFLAHERRIYSYILALVPVWADADDLLQQTSVVLWQKLDQFEPGTNFQPMRMSQRCHFPVTSLPSEVLHQ